MSSREFLTMCPDVLARASCATASPTFKMFARVVQKTSNVNEERLLENVPSALFVLSALPVLMLATGFFWSRSLDVFHYFGPAKASQDAPQVGARLDLVLASILDRFLIDFGRFLGGKNAPKTHPGAPQTGQDEPF